MKKIHSCLVALLLTGLLTALIAGCGGGNSGGYSVPVPPLTGDQSLFPHKELLASPASVNTSQSIVLDARTISEYNAGHIPGAISAPISNFEDNEGRILDDLLLEEQLGKLGITVNSEIMIYDKATDTNSAVGRLFWILKYMGCNNVSVLNGGWDQWNEYYVGTTEATIPPTVTNFTMSPSDTTKSVTKEDVANYFLLSPDDGYVLIDVRTEAEYLKGHIPGAINFPYSECFNTDKTILNFTDLKDLLAIHGIAVEKEMIVYSNLNHRGGFFYFLCQLMGYPNVHIYLGSIGDWLEANPTAYDLVIGSEKY